MTDTPREHGTVLANYISCVVVTQRVTINFSRECRKVQSLSYRTYWVRCLVRSGGLKQR
jgi:hypothetical protein